MSKQRVYLIVLDSFGIGNAPDAADFGDKGANTLYTITHSGEYDTPNMKKLGLSCIDGVDYLEKMDNVVGSYGRMQEASRGKDTTIGHWEIAGIVSEKALPTYPNGFPKAVLDEFSKRTGREILCNKPYSGTDVIRDYGEEHVRTGKLIVYTSADSVFQIAAHEDIVPVEELYRYCEIAREILVGEHGVGRVIARPFVGEAPNFQRTTNRHDFSLLPPRDTMLDVLQKEGYDTYGVGKIYDIFAGKGISHTQRIQGNVDGMEKTIQLQDKEFNGLCFVNLVDFDMLYGHRNDPKGYGKALEDFDGRLNEIYSKLRDEDILIITADHGCDPTTESTDHSREYIPILVYGKKVKGGTELGIRDSFTDIGKSVLDYLGIDNNLEGKSFINEII